jgi:hypothetical protein
VVGGGEGMTVRTFVSRELQNRHDMTSHKDRVNGANPRRERKT